MEAEICLWMQARDYFSFFQLGCQNMFIWPKMWKNIEIKYHFHFNVFIHFFDLF